MFFAFGSPMEFADVREHGPSVGAFGWECQSVSSEGFLGEDIEATALDAAAGSFEAAFDDIVLQSEGFEDLGTFVASQGADAHFSHDFEHPLGDRFAVLSDDLIFVFFFEHPVSGCLPERFESEVRVDCIGAEADVQAVVVDFASFSGLYDDPDGGPFGDFDEVLVDSAAGKQAADSNALVREGSVRQQD